MGLRSYMEQWDPLHQSRTDGGELVSHRYGPNFAKLPLLPYERTLIHTLGMTEDEYWDYLLWVQRKNTAKILENQITAGPALVPTLISLAIGVLFTAVGALLTPKPKALNTKQKQIIQKTGDNEKGRQRYSPTYGFDSLTELGEYGSPIPIHFAQYLGQSSRETELGRLPINKNKWMCNEYIRYVESPFYCGSVVVSPLLVWSRLYSLGKGQLFQGIYVIGDKLWAGDSTNSDTGEREGFPDLKGIWIGNNTLDKVSEGNFAFYYDSISGESQSGRISDVNIVYGTQYDPESGNPYVAPAIKKYRDRPEPFPAPVCDMDDASGFSMTYTLQNQSQFGCFSPIMNGTDRRPPWRVISVPESLEDEARETPQEERKKISGDELRMAGSGRGYGRKMGLTEWGKKKDDLSQVNTKRSDPRKRQKVNSGEFIRFEIDRDEYDEDTYDWDVSVEDLTNESDAERQAADEALQIGEEFMIHASRFRVVERSEDVYELEEKGMHAILECIESRRTDRGIGFVNRDYFEANICDDDEQISIYQTQHVPSDWDPLVRYNIASFRNIRRPEVTEIGIRSQVWAQMNGMCNFPTIPTVTELNKYDDKNIQWSNGVQSQYFTRFSFFELHVRNINTKNPSNPGTWKRVKAVFAIKGETPVDQYNYIRLKPKDIDRYEYRMYPLSGSFASLASENPNSWTEDDVAWVLDVTKGNEFKFTREVDGVTEFEICSTGYLVSISCCLTSPLMLGKKSKDPYNTKWCPQSYCDGKNGKFKDGVGNKDNYAPNVGEQLTNTCISGRCGDGAPNSYEAKIPDYVVDGFDVYCTDCGTWDEPALFSDEECETKYDFEEDFDGEITGDNYIRQTRTAAGPGASARISEIWKYNGVTIQSDSKNGSIPIQPILGTKKQGEATYSAADQVEDNGGVTSGTFTWRIKRCVTNNDGGDNGGGGSGDKNKDCAWNIWERCTQVNEGSYYSGLISRSCDSGAEHEVVYINESLKTDPIIQYPNMTTMGLSLRATRQFTALDQPRLWLPSGIKVLLLESEKLSSDYQHNGSLTRQMQVGRARAAELKTRIEGRGTVDCGDNDERIITVSANIVDDISGNSDPNNEFSKINWMVQWFKGKNRDHNARIKNPVWEDTEVRADWTDRNPHATLISGNVAKIRLPKGYGWVTCYMWPGESNTTNNSDVDNEGGLNFGPTENNGLQRSLTGVQFDSNDKIINIFAGGVDEVRNQRTDGSGNDARYTTNYTYLWSGKNNYSSEDISGGRYVYWYDINDDREQLEVLEDKCPGDSGPIGPPPFTAKINCGNGNIGSPLTCTAENCTSNKGVTYRWQRKANNFVDFEDIPLAINATYEPELDGWYRCEATCRTQTIYTNSCYVGGIDPGPPPPPPPPPESEYGPSSNYANLIYHLLLNKQKGLGQVVSSDMVDKDRMVVTAKFQKQMGLHFDGTMSEQTNLRTFASATAPFFLCNFTITNGKFTLWPVLPIAKNGKYQGEKVKIKQIFTEGNVIDGSFRINYLDADDRRSFKASMRYRICEKNQLPEERVLTTRWYDGNWSDDTEDFDMTQFCTSPEHALLAARYFMWIRNVVTHSVALQTVPEVMNGVGPGDFIKLKMDTVQICRESVASVQSGALLSASTWSDGEHEVNFWQPGMPEPATRIVTVQNNTVLEREMEGALMSTNKNDCQPYNDCDDVYQVEQVNLGEDGLVDLVATYYPCTKNGTPDLYNALFMKGRYKQEEEQPPA